MSVSTDVDTAARAVSMLAAERPRSPAGVSAPDLRTEVPLDQIVFRRVTTAAQWRQVAHLRAAIALSDHLRQSAEFARLEKKEMSSAWWVPSSAWAP